MIRFLFLLLLLSIRPVLAQELNLRHDLEGRALNTLGTLVVRFNDEQGGKGSVRLQSIPAGAEKRRLPELALLDVSDSMEFFGTLPRFTPLFTLMKAAGETLDSHSLFPQIVDAADDGAGRLQALPLALSLPVLYVNRAELRKAGVDLSQIPRTWWELQTTAGQVFAAGSACPLTSSDFSWVHLENLATQHSQPIVTRAGSKEKLQINSLVHVKHLALLASWQKSQYFHYSGRKREGDARFLSGECAMLTGDSSLYAQARERGIDVGIHALPYYDDVYGVQAANIIPDGASVWALAGLKKDQARLAARFVQFLLRPEVQQAWVQGTTYLPMGPAAIDALQQAKAFPEAMLDAARQRLAIPTGNSVRAHSSGGVRERLRAIFGEEVQPVWTSGRPAKEALDRTVRRANSKAG